MDLKPVIIACLSRSARTVNLTHTTILDLSTIKSFGDNLVYCEFASTDRRGEWIQINLESIQLVSGLITQGRPAAVHNQYVTSYKVQCGSSVAQLKTIRENGTDKVRK